MDYVCADLLDTTQLECWHTNAPYNTPVTDAQVVQVTMFTLFNIS